MASASSRREQLRLQQERAAAAARRRTRLVWASSAVVALALVGVMGFVVTQGAANRPDLGSVQTFSVTANHTTSAVQYAQTPPAGGDHHPAWLNCGVYDQPVPNENAVHSLEHGAVWVTYSPDLPAADVQRLEAVLPGTYTILSPYPGLEAPVVASAWGVQLTLDGADDPRLPAFVREYRQGPQTPEPGAACTGGVDAPGKQ